MKLGRTPRPAALEPVDSRSYIFALPIRSAKDLPGDFDFPDDLKQFSYGVFLPRAEPDWLGRRAYPPRAILLAQDALVIVAHPSSGEAPQIIPFRELQFVEYGHFLLIGWISFASPQGIREIPFNTRTLPPVEEFLSTLSKKFAPPFDHVDDAPCLSFGGPLDIKFQNAELSALDRGERILHRFFNPTRENKRRLWGIFPIESHEPGDYLAVTNRRLLWITERNRNSYARYGSIVRSAPLGNVAEVSADRAGSSCRVVCWLKGGACWDVALPADQFGDAAAFTDRARSLINCGSSP